MENQNQQTQTPQSPNQISSVDNISNKSRVIPVILVGLAVVVIAIGVYLLRTKQNQTPVQNIAQTTPIPSPTPIDSTANWKTYTNTKYGFEFKYPKEWDYQIKNYTYSDPNTISLLNINFGLYEVEGPGGIKISPAIPAAYVSLEVFKYDKDVVSPLDTYVKNKNSPAKVTNVMANGIEAKRIEHSSCQSGNCIDVLIFKGDTIIDFYAQNGDSELNQILSTFRFD